MIACRMLAIEETRYPHVGPNSLSKSLLRTKRLEASDFEIHGNRMDRRSIRSFTSPWKTRKFFLELILGRESLIHLFNFISSCDLEMFE